MSSQIPDKANFVEMVYTHMGIIYKICNLYAAKEDREDLKQEIIYQLWKSYPNFRGDSKFQSWMYRVALKITSVLGLRRLKAYLSDLQQGVLDESERMEHVRKRFLWLWVVIFMLLTAFLVFGILKAVNY